MKINTAVFLCAINGILMILYPLIGGLLFCEQLYHIIIIFLYIGPFTGVFIILGAYLAKVDYTLLGLDYIKIGINSIRVGIILGFTSIMVFITICMFNVVLIGEPLIFTLIFLVLYTSLILVGIFLGILSLRNFKKFRQNNPISFEQNQNIIHVAN